MDRVQVLVGGKIVSVSKERAEKLGLPLIPQSRVLITKTDFKLMKYGTRTQGEEN